MALPDGFAIWLCHMAKAIGALRNVDENRPVFTCVCDVQAPLFPAHPVLQAHRARAWVSHFGPSDHARSSPAPLARRRPGAPRQARVLERARRAFVAWISFQSITFPLTLTPHHPLARSKSEWSHTMCCSETYHVGLRPCVNLKTIGTTPKPTTSDLKT